MSAYATRADLFKYGLPRGVLTGVARQVATVSPSIDTLELDGHGFETNDPVTVRAAEGGSLPTPLSELTTYYAIRTGEATFQLAATVDGAPIDLTDAGESVLVASPLPIDEVLEFYSRFVDHYAPAHTVPLQAPYPVTVVATVAELAAKKLLAIAGQKSASVDEAEANAHKQLTRWAKGIPLRDDKATPAANLAVTQTLADVDDPRGWGSGGI